MSLHQADTAEYSLYLALACHWLDEAVFNTSWVEEHKMTLEQAIELTLKNVNIV